MLLVFPGSGQKVTQHNVRILSRESLKPEQYKTPDQLLSNSESCQKEEPLGTWASGGPSACLFSGLQIRKRVLAQPGLCPNSQETPSGLLRPLVALPFPKPSVTHFYGTHLPIIWSAHLLSSMDLLS